MALPRKNRIVKEKDFDLVFNKGKTVKGSFLFIKSKNNGLDTPRFGFAIPKKTIPNASGRNRIKRVLSEIVVKKFIKTYPKEPVDIVIVLKKAGDEPELIRELQALIM